MTRRLHLGLDWGTSGTKMVLRDYDAVGAIHGLAYVLRTEAGSVRHPSLVVTSQGRLWFGASAERELPQATGVWHNLKAEVALAGRSSDSALEGLTKRDLSVLYLASVISRARRAADRLPGKGDYILGFTLGVPTGEIKRWGMAIEYLRLAQAAFHIACRQKIDVDGASPSEVIAWNTAANRWIAQREASRRVTPEIIEDWLRPEAASEMVWSLYSPAVPAGLYTAVDVGAGTTNACFFCIHQKRVDEHVFEKGAITFYGAACAPPGLNEMVANLQGCGGDYASLGAARGRENEILSSRPECWERARPSVEQFKKVWFKARQEAWHNNPGTTRYDGLQLIMVGGGSKINRVRGEFEGTKPVQNIKDYGVVPYLGSPDDLRELPARSGTPGEYFNDDPTFLLTAYGLSYETGDLPEITLPDGVAPLKPVGRTARFLTSEELGYDEK